jgi:pimeloyl-ACP methyl ester carboxylesterase
MRARYPDHEGYVERDGVKVFYEVFGDGNSLTLVLTHGWLICHSELWKMQVGYLSRHYRVIKWDWPGNGRSDPLSPAEPTDLFKLAGWIPLIMEATGTERAVLVGHSWGAALLSPIVAAAHPDLVEAMVLIGALDLGATGEDLDAVLADYPFLNAVAHFADEPGDNPEGWGLVNGHVFRRDWAAAARFFLATTLPEAHSTKPLEDCVQYAADTDGATAARVIDDLLAMGGSLEGIVDVLRGQLPMIYGMVRCPVLMINGTADAQALPPFVPPLADQLHAELLWIEGAGHSPHARDPVRVNLAIREFVDRIHPPAPRQRRWPRALTRRRRVLYLSSPIGLGHARRDLAIAGELRKLRPDLQIEWLAQHPVTAVLEAGGESIHPASAALAGESAHIESEAGEHDLHCFQALRRMDEILLSNFMVTRDVLEEEHFDVVVGDEAWETDYYLHENPELKRAPFCWLTDFVGYLPMPEGGEGEAALTADYNAEMIEQVARYPMIRDRSIFVGNAEDVVQDSFGPGLPSIRDWTSANFAYAGYVTGFPSVADREQLRAALGYRPDETVCVVTVGGSGVGSHLLARVVASYRAASRVIDGLRMLVVTGPRIDPGSIAVSAPDGVEVCGFLPDLWRHLAVCDLAVVQGGLTTCMELAANRRRFLYVPLRGHFEQQYHVAHRLQRYRAGRRLGYEDTEPDALAEAMTVELDREVESLPVETDGASKAAAMISELL